jgi:hypothetical protein
MSADIWHRYDDLATFVDGCTEGERLYRDRRSVEHSPADQRGRSDWTGGTSSVDDACQTLVNGTWSVARKVDALLSDLEQSIGTVERIGVHRSYDVAGGSVNVGRWLSGQPRSMVRHKIVPVPRTGRRVTILANVTASGGVSVDDMNTRGVALCALTEALRMAGIPATVYVACAANQYIQGGGAVVTTTVKVCDSSSAPDRESVMFALAHPSMLRRLFFADWQGISESQYRTFGIGGSYGYPTPFTDEVKNGTGADVVIDAHMMLGAVKNPAKWIREMLRNVGVHVSE